MNRRAMLAMASTATGGVALLAIAWLAARRLSAAELGFFFAFLSFGALVQLADFGLSYAALQTAGQFAGSGRLGDLPALAKRVAMWNLIATAVATLAVAALGAATFSTNAAAAARMDVAWRGPWVAYLVAVFVNQLTMPRLSLREGSGRIVAVWTVRLVQEWIAGLACLIAVYRGAGLWSLAVFVGARALVAALWLARPDPTVHAAGVAAYPLTRWMSDVWPFQWKIGLSGLSGYLIFRAFTPIVLLEKGPVAAGQFGLAISLMNLLIAVSSAWPLSHAARYAALNAAGRFDELRREFPGMLWASTALAALAAIVLSAVLWEARRLGVTVALRLPEMTATTLIFLTAVVHHFVACFAVLLRSEGREPLLIPSVAGGVVTVLIVWLTARFGSLPDLAAATLACAMIGIPIVLYLFRARVALLRQGTAP